MSCSLLGCGFGSAKKSNAGMCTSVLPMLKRSYKKRSYKSRGKKRSYKKRSCRKRSYKKRSYKKKSRGRKSRRRSFGYQVLSNDQIIRLANSNVLKCA